MVIRQRQASDHSNLNNYCQSCFHPLAVVNRLVLLNWQPQSASLNRISLEKKQFTILHVKKINTMAAVTCISKMKCNLLTELQDISLVFYFFSNSCHLAMYSNWQEQYNQHPETAEFCMKYINKIKMLKNNLNVLFF